MKDNLNSKLTACLLVYNHAHLLEKVITSILNQTYSDFKLIISDDCSTDNSYEVARTFEARDTRIKVIRAPQNLGMAGNANYSINQAHSEYVALLHHDDLLHEDTFKEWIDCIESSMKISFVFNDYKTDQISSTNKYLNKKLEYINNGKYFLKKILLKQWGCPVRGTALIRKKYFDEVGGMNEEFGMLADVDLWMRLASKYDVGYVNKSLIEVLVNRPENYPADYTDFSWKRIFLLFNIHSSNINRENFPNYFKYLFKRFIFRNKVSIEIIKWHLYAVYKENTKILSEYPGKNNYEMFYSTWVIWVINLLKYKN